MGKKGKKKKGGKEPIGCRLEKEEEHIRLQLQVETLERELQVKSAHAETALREEIGLRSKVEQMEEDFKKEQATTFAVTADMARQYKALQEELIFKINSLETELTEQKEECDITSHELKELTSDKNQEIEHKDDQIRQLNERMNEMSTEFEDMLSDTLKLMKSHIKEKLEADGSQDETGKAEFMQRLQDCSARAYNAVDVKRPGESSGSTGAPKALAGVEAAAST